MVEILPNFVCQEFHALDEEWVPIVAGVKARLGLAQCFVGGGASVSWNELNLSSVHSTLHYFGGGGALRRQDLCFDPRGGGVGRDRRPPVSRAVLKQSGDALVGENGDHDGCPTIFEARRGVEPLQLCEHGDAMNIGREERCAAFAQGNPAIQLERQGRAVTPM